MESRFLLQDEVSIKRFDEEHKRRKARSTGTCCFSAGAGAGAGAGVVKNLNSQFCTKVAEFACSACVLCVCCPLSIAWCCIKLPCQIGWRAVQRWAVCASKKTIFAAYSSFSDIDSDSMPCKSHAPAEELVSPKSYPNNESK